MRKSHLIIGGIALVLSIIILTILTTTSVNDMQEQVACTADAKLCPDGSSVGRVGPDCKFAECPAIVEGSERDLGEDNREPEQAGKLDSCEILTQPECESSLECRSIFGPSHCSGGICTSDVVFKSCVLK